MVEHLLRYDQVDISYRGELAVKQVSFAVDPGEILGIVGESGSGKSTLIKAAMGLLSQEGVVTRGDIWYRGKNITDLPGKDGRSLAIFFKTRAAPFARFARWESSYTKR